MKIVFFGTSAFAVPALEVLVKEGYAVIAVITTPDEPVGRKQVFAPSPIKVAAQKFGLNILQPHGLKIDEFENYLKIVPIPATGIANPRSSEIEKNCKLKISQAELGIVASYGKIIPREIIQFFPKGLLNIHPSLLPKYRGPSPIQSAILHGEKETGVTIMLIDEKIDHGPTVTNRKLLIANDEKYTELRNRLAKAGADLLIKTLPDYLNGKITPQEQKHSQAIFSKKLSREDGKINWDEPTNKIFNQIRALNPEPGTWTKWKEQVLNILEARPSPLENEPKQPGLISRFGQTVTVATANGYLELETVQLAGKKPIATLSFLNGHSSFLGSTLN